VRAYKALLPDERAGPYLKPVAMLHVVAEAIRGRLGPTDISAVSAKVEALLDAKVGVSRLLHRSSRATRQAVALISRS